MWSDVFSLEFYARMLQTILSQRLWEVSCVRRRCHDASSAAATRICWRFGFQNSSRSFGCKPYGGSCCEPGSHAPRRTLNPKASSAANLGRDVPGGPSRQVSGGPNMPLRQVSGGPSIPLIPLDAEVPNLSCVGSTSHATELWHDVHGFHKSWA